MTDAPITKRGKLTHAVNPLGHRTGCGIEVRGHIARNETKTLITKYSRKPIRCSTDWREHEAYRNAENIYCGNCQRAMS